MRRRLILIVVLSSLVQALLPAGTFAVDPPVDLQFACAQKSNGRMRAATSPSQCDSKKENVVTFSVAAPVTICLKPNGSVRLGTCSGTGTNVSVPSNTPRYFCADMSSTAKTLKWVTDPANCPAGTTAFVVVNHAPTDITLSNSSVAENQPMGTTVGTLSATNPDAGDTFTFTLVSGTGDADNASFQIDGSTLKTKAVFDYETKNSYSIRVRVTDHLGLTYEEAFTIAITDVVENNLPTDIQLSNSSVAENQPAGTNVGTLSATDQDAGATHTFSLVAGAGDDDNAKFQISGSTLQTAQSLDFEADSSLSVRVRADDGAGGSFEKAFTITVTNVNEAPTDIALSNSSVAENEPMGTNVGTLSATDPDAGDTHTFALVAGAGDADNASFQISGLALQTNAVFDFETKNSYSIRVRATDAGSLTFEEQLTITITNVNEPPTDINLRNSSIAENQPAGSAVGTLSTVDDPGSTHTYTLVAGAGDTDNASFQIDGDVLESAAVFDFEVKSSYLIRVRTDDGGGGTFEEQFAITITNVNDAPTDIALSNASVNENEAVGTAVGTLSATDQDVGDAHTFALVAGAGDTDNASFQIDGTTLETNAVFNFEVKSSYSIRVRVTDSGSATHEEQFTISIVDVNDVPVAVADSYGDAVGNTLAVLGTSGSGPHIVLTGNVITSNDTDEDTTFPHAISAVAETVASTGGGSATIAADGSFTFLPGVGDRNQVDTFTYHITDGALQSAGTVSVTIADALVWYVDNASAAATHDGRSSSPFLNLASLNGAGGSGDSDGPNDYIFLYQGTGSYGGGIPLEVNQKLFGEKHGLLVIGHHLVNAGATAPVVTNAAGVGVGLASGVDVEGLNISGTSGDAVNGLSVTFATVGTSTAVNISSAGGDGVDLSGASSGNISIASPITGSAGHSISVANRFGGIVAFSGAISETGTGISLSSNIGATINFSGGITASTGANNAFVATGGGTVSVTGSANTLATTTGTALNVANTTIGASGLTFRSIASNGAVNGIVLNNTGSTGGMTVTGDGSTTGGLLDRDGSGGTIQNATADAVSLTNAANVTLRQMNIASAALDGVEATSGSNIVLSALNVTSPGASDPAAGGDGFGTGNGVRLTNVTGASAVNENTRVFSWQASQSNAVLVHNTNTSFTSFTLDNAFITTSATGAAGFHANLNGTTTGAVTVTDTDFTLIDQNAAQILNNGSGTVTAVVQRNSFHDADQTSGDGNNTLFLALAGSGQLNFTVGGPNASDGNSFSNLALLTSTAGIAQVNGMTTNTNGSTLNGSFENNTISNNLAAGWGKRRGIVVGIEASSSTHDNHNILIANNTITSTVSQGIIVTQTTVRASQISGSSIMIQNNSVGTAALPVGTGGGDGGSGIEYENNFALGTDVASMTTDLSVTGNTVFNDSSSVTGATLEIINREVGASNSSDLDATVLGNSVNNANASGEVFEFLNSASATGPAGPDSCLDLNAANTTPNSYTGGTGGFRLINHGGTYRIEGMSAGAQTPAVVQAFLSPRNGNLTITTGGLDGTYVGEPGSC